MVHEILLLHPNNFLVGLRFYQINLPCMGWVLMSVRVQGLIVAIQGCLYERVEGVLHIESIDRGSSNLKKIGTYV